MSDSNQPKQEGWIYESDTIEAVAASKTTDARAFAATFTAAAARTPEMAADRETMLSWFAVAIEAGRSVAFTNREWTDGDGTRAVVYDGRLSLFGQPSMVTADGQVAIGIDL